MVKKLTNCIYILVMLALMGFGCYYFFFWGKEDYKVKEKDNQNAGNIITHLEEITADKAKETFSLKEEYPSFTDDPSEDVEEATEETDHETMPDFFYADGSVNTTQAETDFTPDYTANTFEKFLQKHGITLSVPEGTKGMLKFVLDYQEVGILRGVYGGYTWADIVTNLDELYHFTTVAAEGTENETIPGKTALAVIVHNSLRTDLAGNGLLKAQTGHTFTIYAENGIYTYQVVNVYALSRQATQTSITKNIQNLPSDHCYLITCGRNLYGRNFRYKNMIIEGVVTAYVPYACFFSIIYIHPDDHRGDQAVSEGYDQLASCQSFSSGYRI